MIGKHCGQRLVPLPDEGDTRVWACSVCHREFRQRARKANGHRERRMLPREKDSGAPQGHGYVDQDS